MIEGRIYGYCYGCGKEVPLDMAEKGPFKITTHAGRDGIKCTGSGRRPAYVCDPPDEATAEGKTA